MKKTDFDEKYEKILEKFKVMKAEAEEDLKFDKSQIENSFDSTMKSIKWLNKRDDWARLWRSFEIKKSQCWKKAFEYYKKEYQLALSTKEEYTMMINTDSEYGNVNELCKVTKDVLDFIDTVIDLLKQRQWEIRNFCEWIKFTNGS